MKRRELIKHWSGNFTGRGHPTGKAVTRRQALPSELINKGRGHDLLEALWCIVYSGFFKVQLMPHFTPQEIL